MRGQFSGPCARSASRYRRLRKRCNSGSPRYGGRPGKTSRCVYYQRDGLKLAFWVGVDRQGLLTADERYEIPPYIGSQRLDCARCHARLRLEHEVRALTLEATATLRCRE